MASAIATTRADLDSTSTNETKNTFLSDKLSVLLACVTIPTTCLAMRVFPIPPGPVMINKRQSLFAIRSIISRTSRLRPINVESVYRRDVSVGVAGLRECLDAVILKSE